MATLSVEHIFGPVPILDITKVTHGPVQLQSCLSLFAVGHSQRESHIWLLRSRIFRKGIQISDMDNMDVVGEQLEYRLIGSDRHFDCKLCGAKPLGMDLLMFIIYLCIFITVYVYSLDGSVFFLILAVHAVLASSLGGLTSAVSSSLLCCFSDPLLLLLWLLAFRFFCFPTAVNVGFNLWGWCAVFVGPDNRNGTLEAQNLLLGCKTASMFSLVFSPSASWPSDFFFPTHLSPRKERLATCLQTKHGSTTELGQWPTRDSFYHEH